MLASWAWVYVVVVDGAAMLKCAVICHTKTVAMLLAIVSIDNLLKVHVVGTIDQL